MKRVAPPPPKVRIPKKGKGSSSPTYAAATSGHTPQKDGEWQLVEEKKKKKKKKEKKVPVPSAQEPRVKAKLPRRTPAARSGDAVRVSAKDSESYAEILKAMKARVNPQNSGAEVGERAEIKSLVSKRSLEVRDLDETVTREEVVAALFITLGKPDLGDQCKPEMIKIWEKVCCNA